VKFGKALGNQQYHFQRCPYGNAGFDNGWLWIEREENNFITRHPRSFFPKLKPPMVTQTKHRIASVSGLIQSTNAVAVKTRCKKGVQIHLRCFSMQAS